MARHMNVFSVSRQRLSSWCLPVSEQVGVHQAYVITDSWLQLRKSSIYIKLDADPSGMCTLGRGGRYSVKVSDIIQ